MHGMHMCRKKKGRTINLADCYIAILAKEHKASILTLDKHLKDLQKDAGLDLIDIRA